MDIYRVTGDSPLWLHKAYDYARVDAFCCGQNIPVEMEFGGDDNEEDLKAIVIIDQHKPIAASPSPRKASARSAGSVWCGSARRPGSVGS